MKQEECIRCGMVFFMPETFSKQCQEQKPNKSFYCPAGHPMIYSGENEIDKERRMRQRLEQENARLSELATEAERKRQTIEREFGRHKKRAAAGTCPCCQRTFSNMSRHMKTKHPEFEVRLSGLPKG